MKVVGRERLAEQFCLGQSLNAAQLGQSWNQQWERAQWEWAAQTRAIALGAEPAPGGMAVTAPPSARLNVSQTDARNAALTQTATRAPAGSVSAQADHSVIIELISRQTGVPREQVAFVPVAAQARIAGQIGAKVQIDSAKLRHTFTDVSQSPTMVVVAADGHRVVVALRDGTLSQADQQALVKRLRAELQARGLELGGLWINGCSWDVGSVQPQMHLA